MVQGQEKLGDSKITFTRKNVYFKSDFNKSISFPSEIHTHHTSKRHSNKITILSTII